MPFGCYVNKHAFGCYVIVENFPFAKSALTKSLENSSSANKT